MDEFASIQHWTAGRQADEWQRKRGVVIGIGDDTAVVDPASASVGVAGPSRLLLAVDTMVETVHFKESTMRDEDVGYKALAANISDIAAMGACPCMRSYRSAYRPRTRQSGCGGCMTGCTNAPSATGLLL